MAASPEFYKPAPALPSPCGEDYYYQAQAQAQSCRTPTGSGISYLKEPTTCPPAPRKPPAPVCKKRLFSSTKEEGKAAEVIICLRLDELERIFRPHPPKAPHTAKRRRRRSPRNNHPTQLTQQQLHGLNPLNCNYFYPP